MRFLITSALVGLSLSLFSTFSSAQVVGDAKVGFGTGAYIDDDLPRLLLEVTFNGYRNFFLLKSQAVYGNTDYGNIGFQELELNFTPYFKGDDDGDGDEPTLQFVPMTFSRELGVGLDRRISVH